MSISHRRLIHHGLGKNSASPDKTEQRRDGGGALMLDDGPAVTTTRRQFPGLIFSCCECGNASTPTKLGRLVRHAEPGTTCRRNCTECGKVTQHIVMAAVDFHDPRTVAEDLIAALFDRDVIVRRGKRERDSYGVVINRYTDDGTHEVYLHGPIEPAELVTLLREAHAALSDPDEAFRRYFKKARDGSGLHVLTQWYPSAARESKFGGWMAAAILSTCRGLPPHMDDKPGPALADYVAQLCAVLDPAERAAVSTVLMCGDDPAVRTDAVNAALAGEFDLGVMGSSISRQRQTVFW
jgi:hypothetical protein